VNERAEGIESFPITADPQNYVRTEATEEALEALQRRVREGRAPVALVGPPGVGKTLLLRVLDGRLGASFRVVYVPFGALPPDELCTWILAQLGESAGRDPKRDLVAASLRLEGAGSALVVILDDAGSMPAETARWLSALVARAERAIRLVVALAESSVSDQVLSSFQPAPSRVQLRALASADETARYLRAHLVHSNAPREVRARFDPASVLYLHRGSGGVPRVLSGLAGELARGTLSVLPLDEAGARDEPLGFDPDPFGVTSDPAAYVPRPATEELLESVEGALREGMHAIGISGPPGLGKTMLLRVLERRLRGVFQAIRVPYTALFPDEFCRWVLVLLGEAIAEDPGSALGNLARRLERSQTPLVLLLDDAGSIPIPTVRYLVELAAETNGAMRLVLAALEDVRTPSILGCLGRDAVTIRFTSRMSEDETAEYIYARLAHARAPTALVEPFDPETVNRLYVESEGIPRELHKLASEIFREGDGAVAARVAAPRVSEARMAPEPEAPPAPLVPSGVEAEEPKREPVASRIPIGGWLAVFALLAVAILLAAIPLLRGGFPWLTATPVADSVVEPPVPVPPPETSVPPALDESVEPIAVEPTPPSMEEPPEIAVVPEPAPPVPEPEPVALLPAVEPISVSINATPWATIEIDGDEVGVTPMAGVLLAPGEHQFRVRMPDGTVLEEIIRIAPDHRHIAFSQ